MKLGNTGYTLLSVTLGAFIGTSAMVLLGTGLDGVFRKSTYFSNQKDAHHLAIEMKRRAKKDMLAAYSPGPGELVAPLAAVTPVNLVELRDSTFIQLVSDSTVTASGFPQMIKSEALESCPGVRVTKRLGHSEALRQLSYFTQCVRENPTAPAVPPCSSAGEKPVIVITSDADPSHPEVYDGVVCFDFDIVAGVLANITVEIRVEYSDPFKATAPYHFHHEKFNLNANLLTNLEFE